MSVNLKKPVRKPGMVQIVTQPWIWSVLLNYFSPNPSAVLLGLKGNQNLLVLHS